MKIINSLEEMKPFYNKNTNTFEFIKNGMWFHVSFDFDVDVKSNIKAKNINALNINALNINAMDINARDIKAGDINAGDIIARDIKAGDINFYGVCYAFKNIKCKSIKGSRKNAKYFCLYGEVKFVE